MLLVGLRLIVQREWSSLSENTPLAHNIFPGGVSLSVDCSMLRQLSYDYLELITIFIGSWQLNFQRVRGPILKAVSAVACHTSNRIVVDVAKLHIDNLHVREGHTAFIHVTET